MVTCSGVSSSVLLVVRGDVVGAFIYVRTYVCIQYMYIIMYNII